MLAQLLVSAGRGDHAAFAQLYDLTSPRMFALAVRQLRCPAEAEALTLRIYLQLWSAAHRYAPGAAHPLVWMVVLAHHTLAEHCAGGTVAVSALEQQVTVSGTRGGGPTTAAGLTRAQHEVLTLVHLGGYSHRQVAELLRLPRITVTAAAREGRRRLGPCRSLQPEPAAS